MPRATRDRSDRPHGDVDPAEDVVGGKPRAAAVWRSTIGSRYDRWLGRNTSVWLCAELAQASRLRSSASSVYARDIQPVNSSHTSMARRLWLATISSSAAEACAATTSRGLVELGGELPHHAGKRPDALISSATKPRHLVAVTGQRPLLALEASWPWRATNAPNPPSSAARPVTSAKRSRSSLRRAGAPSTTRAAGRVAPHDPLLEPRARAPRVGEAQEVDDGAAAYAVALAEAARTRRWG